MDPFTLIMLIGLSTAITATGQLYGAMQGKAMSDYNAAVSRRAAEANRKRGEYEASLKRRDTRRMVARQRALYGKAGVLMTGSPLLVMEETAAQGELDALMIGYGAELGAMERGSEAELEKQRGRSLMISGVTQTATSLLGGVIRAGSVRGGY